MAAEFQLRLRNGTALGDIAGIAQNKVITRRLNRPSSCTFRVPSYMVNDIQSDGRPLLCTAYRQISVVLDGPGLFFHGVIWNIEEESDDDMIYSQVTAYDPMMFWRYRPARDDVDSYSGEAGNLSDPSFLDRNKFGGPIMDEILTASESPGRIPELAEGPLFIDLAASTFTGGGADLSGAPTNWPMTIAEIATLLTNTGELDLVITPIIHVPGGTTLSNMATLQTYTGAYGANLTATVHLDFATGDFNAHQYRRTEGMDTVNNKIFYFLGPRLDQQHWRSNVTGDHPDLPNPPGGDVNPTPIGPLGTLIDDSRDQIGVMMQIGIFDNFGSGSGGSESSVYPLFIRQWQVESYLRARPRNMVYVTPVRTPAELPAGGDIYAPGDFDIGDRITVNIGDKARVVESGAQRIYSYQVEIDDDGVEAIGEMQTSPDQEGI